VGGFEARRCLLLSASASGFPAHSYRVKNLLKLIAKPAVLFLVSSVYVFAALAILTIRGVLRDGDTADDLQEDIFS
jgi:hypothetical protein